MQRVTGIGGIFFAANDPAALQASYQQHLGIDLEPWGVCVFKWPDDPTVKNDGGSTVWTIADRNNLLKDSPGGFMINYRVADLDALLTALRDEGCQVLEKIEDSEYGKFGWVIDPEGNKVELWQPPS